MTRFKGVFLGKRRWDDRPSDLALFTIFFVTLIMSITCKLKRQYYIRFIYYYLL